MDWDALLAGIAGGAENVLHTMSWEREQAREDQAVAERERSRRDANNARGLDLLHRERRYMDETQAAADEKATAAKRQQIFDEWYSELPDEMKKVFRAKQFGVTTDRSDWEAPEAKAAREADVRGQKYLDDELKHTRTIEVESGRDRRRLEDDLKLEGVRHKYRMQEKSPLPVTPKDDPALPVGVRQYLSSLLPKHSGDFDAAEGEWNQAFFGQQQLHPRLDPGQARTYLRNLFGHEPKPKRTAADYLLDATDPAPPESARAAGFRDTPSTLKGAKALEDEVGIESNRRRRAEDPWLPGPSDRAESTKELINGTGRPTAQPIEVHGAPIGDRPLPRSPEAMADQRTVVETKARSLMSQYRNTADPATKAALRKQLAAVRAELLKMEGKRTGQPWD